MVKNPDSFSMKSNELFRTSLNRETIFIMISNTSITYIGNSKKKKKM